MKFLIMLFLILTINAQKSMAGSHYAGVCSRSYAEGRLKIATNGQKSTECLQKKNLPTVYQVHKNGKCNKTHVEGQKIFGQNKLVNKECRLRKSIKDYYETSTDSRCDKMFVTENYDYLNVDGFSTKRCHKRIK
jgi:hypothetical protein